VRIAKSPSLLERVDHLDNKEALEVLETLQAVRASSFIIRSFTERSVVARSSTPPYIPSRRYPSLLRDRRPYEAASYFLLRDGR
jgi:hypothetical protein